MRWILWSGGFDSTALVLAALRAGDWVTPIVLTLEFGPKVSRERLARERIRLSLPLDLQGHLLPEVVLPQQAFSRWEAIQTELLARSEENFSPQAPYLIAVGERIPQVECALIATDTALMHPVTGPWVRSVLVLPFADLTKAQILEAAHPEDRERLTWTWSCEFMRRDPETGTWDIVLEAPVGRVPCGECQPCLARIVPVAP